MDDWTTRVLPEHTRAYGVDELHNVCFVPNDWSGRGRSFCLLIPECEMHYAMPGPNDQPVVFVNRPPSNKKTKYWIRHACEMATEARAFLTFACDTEAEAERVAKVAAKRLPNHQRIALERFYDGSSRRPTHGLS